MMFQEDAPIVNGLLAGRSACLAGWRAKAAREANELCRRFQPSNLLILQHCCQHDIGSDWSRPHSHNFAPLARSQWHNFVEQIVRKGNDCFTTNWVIASACMTCLR